MNITINEKILEQYNLSVEEFLILYICSKNYNIKELLDTIIAKGYADKDVFDEYKAVVSDNVKELIANIIINSNKKVIDKEKDFLILANKMRDLYPSGKKPGTNYPWKDSSIVIAQKLKTLVVKFGCAFTEEEALDATKRYIESFNGNYTYMQLLKYFILKTEKSTGDIKSDFMSLIENKEDIKNNFEFCEIR
jgi:hypothetical protein